MLKWARENAGLEASEVKDFEEKFILSLEEGDLCKISLKVANKISKIYGVSFHRFNLAPPEQKSSDIPDFRNLPAAKIKKYSSSLRKIINTLKTRQEWLSRYFKEEELEPLSFIKVYKESSNPQDIANDIIEYFFRSREKYKKFYREKDKKNPKDKKKTKERFLTTFIDKLGQHGIIVVKCNGMGDSFKIELKEARGFALADKRAPFIFIHSADCIRPQIFTLMLELAHLFIGKEGVSGEINQGNEEENFCYQIASRVLLSDKDLTESLKGETIDLDCINKISNKFFISKQSILLRLKERNLISDSEFKNSWEEIKKEIKAYLKDKQQKENIGGDLYNVFFSRTNKTFVNIVYSAYRSGSITGSQASTFLDKKTDQFPKIMLKLKKSL